MKNIHGQNILAAAIAVSLGCSLTEFLPAAYAAPTDTAQTASNDADDSLMDFSLDAMTVEAKRPDWESKLSPGTVNIVRPDEFKGEQKSLPDLLLTVPGVHVREVNGKGQYTTVTMRGSTAAQVGIFIDGVLANLGGDTAVDLSTIPVKNVERIEVYRGYIPSRFGGTFMGGVINIVTKKPETTDVSLEVGKSSYGGKRGSMEITAPLGDGSLMVGTNYESSDGDFKYKNYAAERYLPYGEQQIAGQQKVIDNFNNETIDYMTKGAVINLQQEQIDYYKANNDAWLGFVRSDSLKDAIYDNRYEYAKKDVGNSNLYLIEQQVVDRGLKDEYLKRGYDDSDWHEALQYDWIGSSFGEGVLTPEIKEEILKEYGDKVVQNNIDKWTNDADPDKNKNQAGRKESLEKLKQKQKEAANATRITGFSDGKRFTDGQASWIHPKDSQTKGKATWQLALKKEVNENLTLRMTGGTYYRLLNMAEIAGDGAGILPAPRNHNGEGAMFPVPEEGKQFDISAIMHNKLLGADNSTTLTYYWRDSTNMLQLERAGKDYWSYFNDNKGKSHGIELQSSFKWNKFDLDLQVTYLNTSAYNKHTATQFGEYAPVWPTYQPEWEGNIRLTYRPSEKFSVFAEGHYTDEYFTYYNKATSGKLSPYLSGKPVCSLFVMNSGLKWMPKKNWQLTFGCNDILNKGPKSKIRSDAAFMVPGYINPEFPIQGRTYYVTARYQF